MRNAVAVVAVFVVVACGGGDQQPSTVGVVKSLDSLQCTGGGTTVAALQGQLAAAGVQVVATSCGSDGVARPSVCGAPDGAIAIFDIPASQQTQAETLNFTPLSAVPTAVKVACQ